MNLAFNMINTSIPVGKLSSVSRISASKMPARDRLISFGKHRGQMLGSLPSSYLKWVSKNLRAGDTQEWAKLADEVLLDPVYRDRMEWELAENILNGNNVAAASSGNNSVSTFLELSERFGWDNDDKLGWSKIDFKLLGTSKGGRIPRTTLEPHKESARRRRTSAKGSGNEEQYNHRVMPVPSPFPGREALLTKVRKTFDKKF